MSDQTQAAAMTLPLFFARLAALSPKEHGALRLDRTLGYGFAAGATAIPLGLAEFAVAARHYPVVFAAGDIPAPLALVGINELGNLFVDARGAWRAEAYVPAYVRAFPFVFVDDRSGKPAYAAVEPDAACLHAGTGPRLFEDGAPGAALKEALQLAAACREGINAAIAFARAMAEAGLLREEEAAVTFAGGVTSRVRGFKAIRAERLESVPDAHFLDWRRRGWLGPLYAQVHSIGNWGRLVDLAAARGAQAATGGGVS